MPVSHRAYGLYGQTRTVNAYGHPKIYPRYGLIRSARTVSTVGRTVYTVRPVRSMRTVTPKSTPDTVSYGQLARSLRSRTVAHTAFMVARTVSTVGRTVYMVSCYGHPERYK